MRKYTIEEKSRGELAIRDLSEKAQASYNNSWPMTVWAYYTDSPEAPENERFSVKFGNELREYMDKGDLEEYLEALADDVELALFYDAIDKQTAEARRDDLTEQEIIDNRFR